MYYSNISTRLTHLALIISQLQYRDAFIKIIIIIIDSLSTRLTHSAPLDRKLSDYTND